MKIYTGRGDDGSAGLLSGERVPKSHERIDAIGDLDELNSAIGVLRASVPKENKEINDEIRRIQSHLLRLGAWVAAWRDSPAQQKLEQIGEEHIRSLEAAIDRIEEQLPELTHLIIPDAGPLAALAHFARSVCRRAERHVVRLSVEVKVGKPPKLNKWVIIYLNRLSDYLFVLGRHFSYISGIPDDICKI